VIGKDTTAQALAWSIYRLLLHPEHIPFLRQEIDAQSTAQPIPYQALTSPTGPLRHVNSFISEVLRLHPPVPMEILQNVSHESVVLPDQTRTIVRPLELVIWCPHNMGRSSRIWGEDATTFRPGRWLEDDKNGTSTKHPLQKTAYEFPVFHGGPRSCLGKPLARAELAFSLVELLRRYDLEPAWDVTEEKRMGSGLLAPVRGGLPVRVRRRR
jgi:cytochrome P450